MSIDALRTAKSISAGADGTPLTRSEKLLLVCLADYVNSSSNVAFPSVRRLAAEVMVSERHIRNLLRSLERKGLLTTEHRTGSTSHYRLVSLLPESVPDEEAREEPRNRVGGCTGEVPGPTALEDQYRAVEQEIGGVVDGFLEDAAYGRVANLTEAYGMALQAAGQLADDLWPGQTQLATRLCSSVVARCATDVQQMNNSEADRIGREAVLLGAGGHRYMVSALLETASSEPKRDRVRYVVGTARRMAAADRASLRPSF
jgi:DNA-binding MarR family transcriptional regulator